MAESRVSTFAIEVLNSGDVSEARVSAFGVEVLMSVAESSVIEIPVGAGALELQGFAPLVTIPESVSIEIPAGELVLQGFAPVVDAPIEIPIAAGELELQGAAPAVTSGIRVNIPAGALELTGQIPLVSTEAFVGATQQAAIALGQVEPGARVSQQAVVMLGEIVPGVEASQQAIVLLADGSPCVTQRAQIWKITRRDGVVFRFTSLDRDLVFGSETYRACASLNPSASENASQLGATGNIELDGIIDDDSITEADLYGGKFDDAFVTIDLVAWGEDAESPRRIASGWTGELSQGETGFRMEVLGAGSRLDQQALVTVVAPGCRWSGLQDPRCGVDVDALSLTGIVSSAPSRGRILALLDDDGAGRQWQNGVIIFGSGQNAGDRAEVKTVDFDTGEIVLWASPAYLAQPGDIFVLQPGCDLAIDGGCTVYANVINFGGFPDVPGSDALMETPDAKA